MELVGWDSAQSAHGKVLRNCVDYTLGKGGSCLATDCWWVHSSSVQQKNLGQVGARGFEPLTSSTRIAFLSGLRIDLSPYLPNNYNAVLPRLQAPAENDEYPEYPFAWGYFWLIGVAEVVRWGQGILARGQWSGSPICGARNKLGGAILSHQHCSVRCPHQLCRPLLREAEPLTDPTLLGAAPTSIVPRARMRLPR